ncbi:MAG: hypothetical protein WAZ48_00840 [Lysobacteraceae bacterium]
MKRILLSVLLAFGVVSAAQAVPPCYPGSVVNVGPGQYLSPTYLANWWSAHTIPVGVANPHYYVAFHATDERCKALYGPSAWAQITGPYALTNTTTGTIAGGVYFQCKKCSGVIAVPSDPVKEK